MRDVGEIDFLNAPSYIDNPTYQMKFGGRSIAAERSAEIATKKLVYRASTYTARDTFDLAAIYLYDRSALGEIAQCPAITDHVVSSALNRLNLAKHQYQSEMRKLINSTPRSEEFIDKSCEIALEALAEIRNLIPKMRPSLATGCRFLEIACRGVRPTRRLGCGAAGSSCLAASRSRPGSSAPRPLAGHAWLVRRPPQDPP